MLEVAVRKRSLPPWNFKERAVGRFAHRNQKPAVLLYSIDAVFLRFQKKSTAFAATQPHQLW